MTEVYKGLSERERFVVALLLQKEKEGYDTTLTLMYIYELTCYVPRELRKIVNSLVEKKIVRRENVGCHMIIKRHIRSEREYRFLRLNGITLNPEIDLRGK